MTTKATGGMAVPAAMPGAAGEGATVEGVPVPTFDWMGLTAEWGTRVRPGEHGLRFGDLNVGIYGEVPEVWEDQTRRPRGALPRPGVPPLPYNLRSKYQMWADSAANLYEEAIQRRWIPATDVPWQTLEAAARGRRARGVSGLHGTVAVREHRNRDHRVLAGPDVVRLLRGEAVSRDRDVRLHAIDRRVA